MVIISPFKKNLMVFNFLGDFDMARKVLITSLLAVLGTFTIGQASASQLVQMELANLSTIAQGAALAKVLTVTKKSDDTDEAAIKIVSVLKGNIRPSQLTIELKTRGVKDFDPSLKPGDMGVFFLKEISQSTAKLAYAGSVALFPKPNFKVSDKPAPPKTGAANPRVKLETSMGDIVIELNSQKAPITVKNFLRYVEERHFDNTIFHRVIKNFMIQGGGFTPDMKNKPSHEPIVNEANNDLKNLRGTIAMARTNNPNSATAQFFINHKDNRSLNYIQGRSPGYAVFGKVVQGMDVVDAIANVKTTTKNATRMGRQVPMKDVPAETVLIKSATLIATQ